MQPSTEDKKSVIRRHPWITLTAMTIAVSVVLWIALTINSSHAEEITVYKSPTCVCCSKWVEHLEDSGFTVKAHNRNDMQLIKQQLRISRPLQSCHTAIINGYVIEGHVPAADIKRLLAEKPQIHGLTVPGMPMGSPGMEGPRKDAYNVLAIDRQGKTTVYNQYRD